MKFTKRKLRVAKERFSTYSRFNSHFCPRTFLASNICLPQPDPKGYTVLESFYIIETFGAKLEEISCQKPLPVFYACCGKIQLNWQIEQWADGYSEWTLFIPELREWYPWFPEWVFDAVMKQGESKKYS